MKYKLFSLFLGVLFMFGFAIDSSAATNVIPMGNGQYYNTATGMNTTSPTGSCTENDICAATTDVFNAARTTAENTEILNDIVASGGSASDMGSCTGEILTNLAAAQDCADKAQAQARARGYDATCTVEKNNFPGSDPNTGLDYYFDSTCTINGSAGHGAYLLAGFDAASGSTALIQHINPGWDILGYEVSIYGNPGGGAGGINGAPIAGGTPYSTLTNDALQNEARKTVQNETQRLLAGTPIAFQKWYARVGAATPASAGGAGAPASVGAGGTLPECSKTMTCTTAGVEGVKTVSASRLQEIISKANVLLYSTLSTDEQTALTNYLITNRTALLDQNFQTFAPASIFAWALSMGTSTTLNDEAKSLGFTNLNPTNPDPTMWRFVKTPGAAVPAPVSTSSTATICYTYTGWYKCGGDIPYNPNPTLNAYWVNGKYTVPGYTETGQLITSPGCGATATCANITPPPTPPPTTGNLQVGSTGQDVRDLQRTLGITADGIFGPNTKTAVIAYQQKNGLVADGIVGPATKAKLATNPPVPTPTPIVDVLSYIHAKRQSHNRTF